MVSKISNFLNSFRQDYLKMLIDKKGQILLTKLIHKFKPKYQHFFPI